MGTVHPKHVAKRTTEDPIGVWKANNGSTE